MALPLSAMADEQYDLLKRQVEALQSQLAEVQAALQEYASDNASKAEVAQLRQEVAEAREWKEPNSLIHMAGYADVGYANQENADGSFNVGTFSPIFHYQYRDIVMLESELEIEVGDEGETDVTLEYLTVDYFLNDYVTLLGGKFLSPIGQFRQNLHPSWINKLASAPPGFGHDGAAPVSDVGFQARGGFPVSGAFANYAVYVSNGPELIATVEDDEIELEGVEAEGFGNDSDGDKVFGGRLGIVPLRGLEIGISAASGKAAVTSVAAAHGGEEAADEENGEDGHGDEGSLAEGPIAGEPARDYDVLGFDFAWRLDNFALRGEYVKTKIGEDTEGLTASDGATWKTWYTQASFRFPQTNWETVLRYTDFDSPHASQDQQQWALGLNYLFTSSFMGKLTYEFNDGQAGGQSDTDRWMFQLAYGF
jgi:hypothetical protein